MRGASTTVINTRQFLQSKLQLPYLLPLALQQTAARDSAALRPPVNKFRTESTPPSGTVPGRQSAHQPSDTDFRIGTYQLAHTHRISPALVTWLSWQRSILSYSSCYFYL